MINVMRKRLTIFSIFLILLLFGIVLLSVFSVNAQDKNKQDYKYFKSIVIEEGDSLWSIANEYISEEYKGIEDYIKELKSMNGLNSDTIHAGQNLIVAYYSDELK